MDAGVAHPGAFHRWLLAFLVLGGPPAFGQATLRGTVSAQDSTALGGADVTALGAIQRQVFTDRAGGFTIRGVPPGEYTLTLQYLPEALRGVSTRGYTRNALNDGVLAENGFGIALSQNLRAAAQGLVVCSQRLAFTRA